MINKKDMVINYLLKHRGIDFSGCCHSMVEHQLEQRMNTTGTRTAPEYYEYLQSHPEELDSLIDSLTINASGFFRDPLVFSYLSSKIFPKLISEKAMSGNPLRIWSAGCAAGEEPYSVAIEISKLMKNVAAGFTVNIIATDINAGTVDKARAGRYTPERLSNIRFEYLKHFTQRGNTFSLKRNIKQQVNFSRYDLLDEKSYCPPESVYGGFDVVLCRNVLIYYNTRYRNRIFIKLHRSLNENGYLVMGETETPTKRFQNCFKKVNECCHIFKKITP
ncbi:protein-glutamate O-methyltransferase CheR [Desulfococcaceae bacterium HSG9]|nr:protein-glutamate O-methyltransferase CheR [Desulfococcaceae bacterium HSG9]